MAGQNDYETIESRLEPPPMIPRAPGNASAELATGGLPHTPALTSKDDVDLESGRNPADVTASLAGSAEHISSKRSDTAMIKESKKGGSSESEAEKPAEKPKKEVKNNNGVGTFCCIFSAVTIFLAVICLLGLGAMFLYNTDDFVPSRNSTGNTTDTTTMSPIALKLEQPSVGTTSAQNTSQTGKTVTQTPSSLTTTRPTLSSEVTTSSEGTTHSDGTSSTDGTTTKDGTTSTDSPTSTDGTTTKDGTTSTDGTTTTEGTTSADETTTVLTTTDSVTTESSVATSASTTASTRVSTTAEATTAEMTTTTANIAVTDTTTDLITSTTNDGPIN